MDESGLLIGVIASGLMVTMMMSNGGSAWDNGLKQAGVTEVKKSEL